MPISKSLSKLPSSHKILYIKHTLNKSPTKIAPLFDKNQRFEKLRSFSPNKFYNLPNSKSLRATSFGYGTKTNFANKNVIDPGNYNIPSGFAKDKKNIPSFSISRQEYYQGRSDRSLKNLAPGMYNIKTQSQNKFYMGRKLSIRQKLWPGPGQYNLDKMNSTIKKSQLVQKIKDKKMKTEYDEDCIRTSLKSFLKQTPGPGSYHIQNHHTISLISKLNMSNGFKFCKQPKLRKKEKHTNIGPGSYQIFSEFSNPQSDT